MGAQQSSTRDDATGDTASSTKTCYYELLGIERQASDDEIKKAYRKKALELHPDRNFNNVAVATEKFAQVQSAYEVLSDPQERAWYDSHRDAILSGQDGPGDDDAPPTFRNVRLTTTEEILSLMRRFTPTIPFDDEPTGFYGIARETFEHLALEEDATAEYEDLDSPDYPTFGSSDDDYDTVVKQFYSSWAGFSTRKSFSWKDKYRLSDAPDRRVRRLMEKENKKLRDDAIREFNDAVRFLVTFVRKRDPRYIPNSQTDAERQKSMRDAAAAQAARSRAAHQEKMSNYQVPDWAQSQETHAEDDYFTETDEESEVEVLECVVCNKIFKSDKQLEAHERSKKHIKAVQQLRRQMRKEGTELDLDAENESKEDLEGSPDDQEDSSKAVLSRDASPQRASKEQDDSSEADLEGPNDRRSESDDATEDDDYAPRSAVQDRILSDNREPATKEEVEQADVDEELAAEAGKATIQDTSMPQKKKGKAKAKREKKAAQSSATDTHRCSVCNETLESRTKLFQHIRDEGHAAPIPVTKSGGKASKKKR